MKELKRDQYQILFEHSADAMLIIDDGKFVDCNEAVLRMLGYANREELFSTHPSQLSPPKQPDGRSSFDKANEMIAIAMETGSHRFEWIHTRSNGEDFPVEVLLTAIPFEDRKILHVVWRDISERKEAEESLRRAQKMESIGQLTGGVAHDFNNLLGVMVGNIELLEGKLKDDPDALQNLERLKSAADRSAALTQRLLAFSRQQPLSSKATDVNALVKAIEDMLRRTLGETVDFSIIFADDLWPALVDGAQLDHALVNLAVNAKHAMPQGGLLTIETSNVTLDKSYDFQHEEVAPGDYIKVSVKDVGHGMNAEVREKAFEPFFTTKGVGEGSGLGLSMVYGFIKQSGGHITIDSKANLGTTVNLYLPRSSARPQDAAAGGGPAAESLRGRERILVVEDDPGLLEISREFLEEQGYEIIAASNGEEALKILEGGDPFGLLFTDVVLPGGMNGVEIAQEARRIQPGIKVLYATGYSENAVIHGGELDKSVNLLIKPYHRADLLERVRTLLDSGAK